MYYIDTVTADYTITTSYATRQQAEKYGGCVAHVGELHLLGDGEEKQITEFDKECDLLDFGRVRTIFRSAHDGATAGRYLIYLDRTQEDSWENWEYSGISFQEYSDANKFLKSKSMVCFGDILVVENPYAPQAFSPVGTTYSTDMGSPIPTKRNDTVELRREIHC